jgi:hypothetical protein
MPAPQHPRRTLRIALALTLLSAATLAFAQMQAPAFRTVSGTITDDSHEPLRGAVVELEEPASHAILSFLTQDDGHYEFKRINSHADYQLWATFRGHKSTIHNISSFDDHLNKIINIVCKTY